MFWCTVRLRCKPFVTTTRRLARELRWHRNHHVHFGCAMLTFRRDEGACDHYHRLAFHRHVQLFPVAAGPRLHRKTSATCSRLQWRKKEWWEEQLTCASATWMSADLLVSVQSFCRTGARDVCSANRVLCVYGYCCLPESDEKVTCMIHPFFTPQNICSQLCDQALCNHNQHIKHAAMCDMGNQFMRGVH